MVDEDNAVEALRGAPPAKLDIDVCRALSQHVELRAADGTDGSENDSPGTMVGYFSRFNEWYEINSWFEGHFVERIAPGAFKRTFNNRSGQSPVRVLLEHGFDPTVGDKPLGRHQVLREDENGAYAEVELFDTSYNRDLVPALRGGAYGQSFRFMVQRDEFVEPGATGFDDSVPKKWADLPQRTINEVRIAEHGPTVFPASPTTNADMRSTSDEFYERLRRRDSEAYDTALARSKSLRLPQTPDPTSAESGPTEDPQTRHSEDSPKVRHSEDSSGEHSAAPQSKINPSERSKIMANETMTVEERSARQSEIRARLAEIDQEFSGAELSEEARNEFDQLNDEYDAHSRAIDAQEERRARLAAIDPETDSGRRTQRGTDNGPAFVRKPENIYDLSEARSQARSVDELPTIYRDRAMRAVEQARFPGVEDRAAAQRQVERLLDTVDDEQGTLARRILVTGSPVYSRAFGKALTALNTGGLSGEEQRALSLGSDAAGGYAVPFQLDPTVILTSDGVVDPLREMSRVEQITGKEWQGVSSAGVTVSRSAEGTEVGDNSPALSDPSVKTTRVTGFVPFSVELESAWSQLQSEITMILSDAKATEEADSFLNGDGTGENPEGLITKLTATAGSQVATAATSSYAVADLYALDEALPPRHRARANFLAAKAIYNKTRNFGTTDGSNLWVRLGAGTPPELIGYPAREASEMGTDITADLFLVLGNFSRFLIVDRVGMRVELVPHLLGANGRPTGQRGILAIWDNACKVLDANAFRALKGHTV